MKIFGVIRGGTLGDGETPFLSCASTDAKPLVCIGENDDISSRPGAICFIISSYAGVRLQINHSTPSATTLNLQWSSLTLSKSNGQYHKPRIIAFGRLTVDVFTVKTDVSHFRFSSCSPEPIAPSDVTFNNSDGLISGMITKLFYEQSSGKEGKLNGV